jgi:hypothetical protein
MSRQILLPSFLQDDPWVSLVNAIDSVFKTNIDDPVVWLSRIREHYLLNDTVLAKIESGLMVSESLLDVFDKETVVQNISLSGLAVPNSGQFTSHQLNRLLRDISAFWYEKGTDRAADFISYILNTPIDITNLWTEDYVTFLPEGDVGIGTPIYLGGTWYPTTHIQFAFDPLSVLTVPLTTILNMFLLISNYNIVIGNAALELFLAVSQDGQGAQFYPGTLGAPAYAVGLYYEAEVVIRNP